jgi:hypothetical protein
MRWLPGEFGLYGVFGVLVLGIPRLLNDRARTTSWMLLVPPSSVLIMAQHRSGFLALAAATLATGVFLIGSRRVIVGVLKLTVAGAAALTLYMVFLGSSYIVETLTRIQHTFDATEGTANWRLLAWFDVWEGIVERPLGHGFATWEFWFTWQDPLVGSHNGFLDLTYRIGVPGLFLFLAIPLALTLRTRRTVSLNHSIGSALPVTACACIYAWLGYAFFNVVFATPYVSIFFWILLAVGASATAPQTKTDDHEHPIEAESSNPSLPTGRDQIVRPRVGSGARHRGERASG